MTPNRDWMPAITELTEKLFDDDLSADEQGMLKQLLSQGPEQRGYYLAYANVLIALERHGRFAAAPVAIPFSEFLASEGPFGPVPHVETAVSSVPAVPSFPSSAIQGTLGYFSSGWPVAYLVATVVVGVGLLIGASVHPSTPVQMAQQTVPRPSSPAPSSLPSMVGRITGMVDCQWADPHTAVPGPVAVPLGRKYALASGLMEITYDTGARVILQGPCTYEVESPAGGFLSLGKVTAKLAKKEERRTKNEERSGSNSSFLIPHSYFAVRTPTATVTDLGTEFGVAVSREGQTEVHVIQGLVEASTVCDGGSQSQSQRLTEGQAIQIGTKSEAIKTVAFAPQSFTRTLQPSINAPAEAAYIDAVLADNPLAYWPLNETSRRTSFLDRSGHGYHGDAMNQVACAQGGPLGADTRAITLDGHGYLDMGRHDEFSLVNNFTVEAWICIDGDMDPPGWVISAANGERTLGWGFGAICTAARDDKPAHAIIQLTTWNIEDYQFTVPMEMVGKDRWLHVAMVCDANNTVSLYLNGERRESMAWSQAGLSGPVWVTLGCETPLSRGWKGRLAHVAVYPRTLGKEQIQNHFQQRSKNDAITGQ